MDINSIRAFWNQAAEANPYWYVSSVGSYHAQRDLNSFWDSGHAIWSNLKRLTGYTPALHHRVVEIGCGVGRLTRAIAPEVGNVIALDVSSKMLELARQSNLGNVEFRQAEGFSLPRIPEASADLVIAYCVFQHLPSLAALRSYLAEMTRVSQGMIAFTMVPREFSDYFLPLLRIRSRLRRNGPMTYRREWTGIRPSSATVSRLSPIPLARAEAGMLELYYGHKECTG